MHRQEYEEGLARIRQMERLYDALYAHVHDGVTLEDAGDAARKLEAYYTGGVWLGDYEADEKGAWPADLKRGVLSQDAVYDLLSALEERTED